MYNTGFFGVPVKPQKYDVSFYARSNSPVSVQFTAGLFDESGQKPFATSQASFPLSTEWAQIKMSIDNNASSTSLNNTFGLLVAEDSPDVQLNLISVFPPTWEGTIARSDLAQALADIKPAWFRLPGGNALEGNNLKQRFVWNNTVGDLKERQGRKGTWAGWDTDGYGLNEAYQLFTKMGAEPVLGIFAGYTLDEIAVPKSQLQPYIDSIADEMHYLTDAAGSSDLAKRRAADGQEAPWNIPWVEIGNEDWLTDVASHTYNDYRYKAFADVVEANTPNSTKPLCSSKYIEPKTSIKGIDLHDYLVPEQLIAKWDEKDSWERNGTQFPEIEFSTLNSGLCGDSNIYNSSCRLNVPTLIGAIAEATFMMGLERNGDISFTAAYAPLFDHADHAQWKPDLIKFNSLEIVKSTSYYVQQAFGNNRIANTHDVTNTTAAGPVYWSVGTPKDDGNTYIIKLSNVAEKSQTVSVALDEGKFTSNEGFVWEMANEDRQIHNDIGKADAITPNTRYITENDIPDGVLTLTLPANAFTVITLKKA